MATATRKQTQRRSSATAPDGRKEFINTTQGWLGVVKVNRRGEENAVPVAPGARVFLTAEEIELTAQQHQRLEDSPFEPREITHRDPQTGDPVQTVTLCQLEPADDFRRAGGKVLPDA